MRAELYPSNGARGVSFCLKRGATLHPIQSVHAAAVLKDLTSRGELFFRGEKLLFDFLSKPIVQIEVIEKSLFPSFVIHNRVISWEKCDLISIEDFFFFLIDRTLYSFEVETFLLKRLIQENPLQLSDSEWVRFYKESIEHPIEGAPTVIWLDEEVELSTEKSGACLVEVSRLYLMDAYGSFANVESRDKRFELLETGYKEKREGNSSWYCRQEEVLSSIKHLHEKGWEILDKEDRRLVFELEPCFEFVLEGSFLQVKGGWLYKDREFSFEQVKIQGAFVLLGFEEFTFLETLPHKEWLQNSLEGKLPLTALSLISDGVQDLPSIGGSWVPYQEKEPSSLFLGKLRRYQQEGYNWLHFLFANRFGALLADDMGLGKTVQVIAFLASVEGPILIVVPNSLVVQWQMELNRFLPSKEVHVYQGSGRKTERLSKEGVHITTYGTFREDRDQIKKICFSVVVLDEAQVIKNARSEIHLAVLELLARFRISLTGTPLENSPQDLAAQAAFLLPALSFRKESLQKEMVPFMLRRLKEDLLDDLPEKEEQVIYLELYSEQRALYEELRTSILKEPEQGAVFAKLLRLRQIVLHPHLIGEKDVPSAKFDRIKSDVLETIQANKKTIVFSQFTSLLKRFQEDLLDSGAEVLYLDGSTSRRDLLVKQFQEGKGPMIFLMSLKAGGVGLNLTAADYLFLCDSWWNAMVERQAIDRAYRIGREGKLIARRYIALGTIEEHIEKIKEKKLDWIEEYIEGGTTQPWLEILRAESGQN